MQCSGRDCRISRLSELETFFRNPHSIIFLENWRFLVHLLVAEVRGVYVCRIIIRSLKSVLGPKKVGKIRIGSIFFYVNTLNDWLQLFPTLPCRFTYSRGFWIKIVRFVACCRRRMSIMFLAGDVLGNEKEGAW